MSTDYAALRLKHHSDPAMMDAILQDECRAKCVRKLPDAVRHSDFRFPSLAVAEMATSEAVALVHTSLARTPKRVLDMTAGLGIDSFAFASIGCKVTSIEIDPINAEALRHNIAILGLSENITVVEGDSVAWLQSSDEFFDLIYIDPARRDNNGRHFTLTDCHPDVTAILPLLKSHCRTLMIKTSPMLNTDALKTENADVAIIGTTKECKELVFIISDHSERRISCHTVGKGNFEILPQSEQRYDIPTVGQILLQPYPAVMKAGPAVTFAEYPKLHPFSHLYTSTTVPIDFPGEAYRIDAIHPFDKRGIKAIGEKWPVINVAVRNLPITAPELAKRLKIKEGGGQILFGTTDCNGKKILIVTTPIRNSNPHSSSI